MKVICLVFLSCIIFAECEISNVVVTLITQRNTRHIAIATKKQHLWQSSNERNTVVLLSTDFDTDGEPWTISPLLQPLFSLYGNASWFVFVSEWTEIDFRNLQTTLDSHNRLEDLFIGHVLEDKSPTIIHHYGNPRAIAYPLLSSGFILSAPALSRMADLVDKFNPSFNIDASYEFSQFLVYLRTPSMDDLFPSPSPPPQDGLTLTHDSRLCPHSTLNEHCATAYSIQSKECVGSVSLKDVFFAVKTCTQFHAKRLTVVQSTWATDLSNGSVGYYSDSRDDLYHTIDIGVPNTERGHCGKLEAILRLFAREHRHKRWLVIADDDTLLSVSRLLELLSCYDSTRPMILGEVYGYGAHREGGTSYITGGGSMVVSQAAVKSFISSGRSCPMNDYPDDMYLGSIARLLHWDIVHSALFHQSQPASYSTTLLKYQRPISFHKHSPMDPVSLYSQYLVNSDITRDRTEL